MCVFFSGLTVTIRVVRNHNRLPTCADFVHSNSDRPLTVCAFLPFLLPSFLNHHILVHFDFVFVVCSFHIVDQSVDLLINSFQSIGSGYALTTLLLFSNFSSFFRPLPFIHSSPHFSTFVRLIFLSYPLFACAGHSTLVAILRTSFRSALTSSPPPLGYPASTLLSFV